MSRAARAHPLAQVLNAAESATATGEAAIEERVSTRWPRRRRRRSTKRTRGSLAMTTTTRTAEGGDMVAAEEGSARGGFSSGILHNYIVTLFTPK